MPAEVTFVSVQASGESQQSPSAFTPRRRWAAGLTLALAIAAGAGASHIDEPDHLQGGVALPRPTDVDASERTQSPASSPKWSTSATPAASASASASATAPAPGGGQLPHHRVVPAQPQPRTASTPSAGQQADPAHWSNRQLAAVLVITGAKMGDASAIRQAAQKGIAGVVIFGPPAANLAQTLRDAKAAAPGGNPPLFASDEEGGQVQRLGSLIYPLPSAEVMGGWAPAKITRTARDYARRMRALGMNVSLSPDTDLAVPGHFIATAHRSFSADPRLVGVDVNAWNDGLAEAGVLGVVKHWPGHGQATDTHVGSSLVPSWSSLQRRDLLPFRAAFAHHVAAVMVGHLRVPGLTEGSLPTSQSPAALRALRAQAGGSVLVMTDDLSMAAASTALGQSPAQAAVRSLVAGADVAMVCWAPLDGVTSAVRQAIDDGRLPHDQAVASARRVLRSKSSLAARP